MIWGLKSNTRLCRSLSFSFSSLIKEEMYSTDDGLARDSFSNGDTSVNLQNKQGLEALPWIITINQMMI